MDAEGAAVVVGVILRCRIVEPVMPTNIMVSWRDVTVSLCDVTVSWRDVTVSLCDVTVS